MNNCDKNVSAALINKTKRESILQSIITIYDGLKIRIYHTESIYKILKRSSCPEQQIYARKIKPY